MRWPDLLGHQLLFDLVNQDQVVQLQKGEEPGWDGWAALQGLLSASYSPNSRQSIAAPPRRAAGAEVLPG